jgi:nucleoside diphosphate kinase
MYILLKKTGFLGYVISIIQSHNVEIVSMHTPSLTREQAEVIYNNFRSSPHYENAVQSLLAESFVFILQIRTDMSVDELKEKVQGRFGTTDETTIRGHIFSAIGSTEGGFVHIPDSEEKAIEDSVVFGVPYSSSHS